MKFVKKSIYLLLAIAMVVSFNFAIEYETLAIEKMNDELMELMSWVSDTTPFSVMIELKDKVPQDKLQKALDEVYKEYDMDAFYASEADYIGNDKAYEEDYPELLAHYDAYAAARMKVLASFYYPHNYAFLEKYDLEADKEEGVGLGVPYIHNVVVNKGIVNKMLYDSDVISIAHFSTENETDFGEYYDIGDKASDAMQYVRGDINDLGVYGVGIKVGLIEEGIPNSSIQNVTNRNVTTYVSEHATQTCSIIRLLSPYCHIYTYSTGKLIPSSEEVITSTYITNAFDKLCAEDGVHVINMSMGALPENNSPEQNLVSKCIDKMIKQYNVPLVISSGNSCQHSNNEQLKNQKFGVSLYATGFNSICVGGISAPGTADALGKYLAIDPANTTLRNSLYPKQGKWNTGGTMEMYMFSCWRESINVPNKPDLVAPAGLIGFSEEDTKFEHGTSFSAPYVTSSIAWMLARNVYMQGKVEQIKATVIGSAYTRNNVIKKIQVNDVAYNTNVTWTNNEYALNGNATKDYYGAGVLNAAYCYNVAYLGQKTQFTFTAEGQEQSYNVNVNGGLPFRIAIAWSATPDSNSSNYNLVRNKYSITISKPGVNGSTITYQQLRNMYQEITLTPAMISNYGTGTYTVTIRCLEYNVANDIVGMAWNNLNPLGYAPFNIQ